MPSHPASHQSRQTPRLLYNRLSRWYDLLSGWSEARARRTGLHMLDIRAGETVLEIGPATGQSLPALAGAIGTRGCVIGIDIAERMLARAHDKLRARHLADRVTLVCGDALDLPFQSASFDAVFMSFTLELFPPVAMSILLHECRRVSSRGGRMCVVSLAEKARSGIVERAYAWAHTRFPAVIDCRPISVDTALSEAGFRVLQATDFTLWGLAVRIVLAEN